MSFIAIFYFFLNQDSIKVHILNLVVMEITTFPYYLLNISSLISIDLYNLSRVCRKRTYIAFLVKITYIINLRTFQINIKIYA